MPAFRRTVALVTVALALAAVTVAILGGSIERTAAVRDLDRLVVADPQSQALPRSVLQPMLGAAPDRPSRVPAKPHGRWRRGIEP